MIHMSMSSDSSGSDPKPGAFSWPAAFAVVALLAVAAALWVFERVREVPSEAMREGRQAIQELRRVAEAFNTGTVVTSFVSYATEISGSSYFQFATLEQIEVFEQTDSRATLWGQLRLPDVIVQARAPVTYTYYLDLDGHWEMRFENGVIHVLAPEIGHNTPALDASALSWEVRSGSVFRNEGVALDRLKSGLTAMADRRADENVALVREMGRRKTAAFVEQWLARGFSDAESHRVEVLFADEIPRVEAPRPEPVG
jgi:hypothetical protein